MGCRNGYDKIERCSIEEATIYNRTLDQEPFDGLEIALNLDLCVGVACAKRIHCAVFEHTFVSYLERGTDAIQRLVSVLVV